MTSPPRYEFGKAVLDLELRTLSGPRGEVRLEAIPFAIIERLMRRPGAIITHGSLIEAVWTNPDDEPEDPEATIRGKITALRNGFLLLGCTGRHKISIKNERGVGYFLELWRGSGSASCLTEARNARA